MNWLDRNEYPFQSRFLNVNGQSLHYIDEGEGEVLVFVHGTPSWSFDFRNVIKKLQMHYRCVAFDHIGFGLSDKPSNYDYSIQNHSRTLEALLDHLQLSRVTLVMHDFGGPIGFNFAIANPNRVSHLVVLNSWLWSSKNEPEFIRLSRILRSPLLPFLYLYLNFSPRFLMPSSFGKVKPNRHIQNHFTRPFPDKSTRYGTLAFARSLLHDQDWFESLWSQRAVVSNKPILLIWGLRDPFVTSRYLEKFASGFCSVIIKKLASCGHFPQEEQPEEVVSALNSFLQLNRLVKDDRAVAVNKNAVI